MFSDALSHCSVGPGLHSHLLQGEGQATQRALLHSQVTPRPCFSRGSQRGGKENHSWPLPTSRPARSLSPAAGDRDGGQYPAQTASCCCPLHSLACLSLPNSTPITSEPHALLCLCLGPREREARENNHTPLPSPHRSPACSPRGTQNTQPAGHTNKPVLIPGTHLWRKGPAALLSGPAFGQECTQIPPFILKMAKKKRLYCLQLPSQPGSSTTAAAKPTGAPHSLPTASSLVPPLTPRDAPTRCTHSRTYFMVLCFMSHDSLPTALCHLYL